MQKKYDLSRFREAQAAGIYEGALGEIKNGRKTSHWMWFIFPQLKGLGRSPIAEFYGLANAEEAARFLAEPTLGKRMQEICQALIARSEDDPVEIFGFPDNLKLRSSMTIFDYVAPNGIFAEILKKFYAGEKDELTLALVNAQQTKESSA